jgi:signal transduction histidine kinase
VSLSSREERLPLPDARDEVRRLGETLNAMLARLRASIERERQFVADAGHELRTPIAVVKTEIEAALRDGDLPPEAREGLQAALAETDVLAQLAEDLLVLARAGDGALAVRPEPLDARDALESAAQRFADRAAGAGRTIEVRAPEGVDVSADPLRLRQAVGNLVDNALRHGSGPVVLDAAPVNGVVELRVSDGGPGFPDDLADRAFERFTRGDAARTRGGAGLGLAIVRAIAEAHGGSADVEAGAPTTVRIRLPSAGSQQTRRPSAA